MNSKIYFVTKKIWSTVQNVYEEMKYASCQLSRDILINKLAMARAQGTTYGHLLTGEVGYLCLSAGDVIYLIQCQATMVEPRQTAKCYQNLPILYKDEELFMETKGRVIVKYPAEIPCARLTLPKFKIAGRWIQNDGTLQLAQEPIILSPRKLHFNIEFDNLENILLGGIYTDKDLKKYSQFLAFPQKIQTANDLIADRIVDTHEYGTDFSMANLFTKNDLTKFRDSLLTDFHEGLLTFGSYVGAVVGVVAIFNLIRTLITTVTNFKLLKSTLGWGLHLGASCFTSLTNYIIRNNLYNINQEQENENGSTRITGLETQESSTNPVSFNTAREQLEAVETRNMP